MADGPGTAPHAGSHAVARDWITIWHSELAALALDRDMREGWLRLLDLWARTAELTLRALPGLDAAGSAGAVAPPGAAPAMAASDPRDAAIRELEQRLAALEQRLAARDGHAGGGLDAAARDCLRGGAAGP